MSAQEPDNSLAAFIGIKPEPAGFWIRLSAFIIDLVCVWAPCIWVTFTFIEHLISKHGFGQGTGAGVSLFGVIGSTFFYQALTIGKWGQTLGKFAAGITAVRKNGEKLGYLRSFGRTLVWYIVTSLVFFSLTVFLPTCGAGSPFTVVMLAIECLLGSILQGKIFFYDNFCGTRVIYKNPVGRLRKMAVVLFGITVLTVMSYQIGKGHGWITEKARLAEAMSVISHVKSEQQAYYAIHKTYAGKFTLLNLNYSGMTADGIATKFYKFAIFTSGCGEQPCYIVTATRHNNNGMVAAKHGLYSLKVIIPDRPEVQITSCPGGYGNCDELIK